MNKKKITKISSIIVLMKLVSTTVAFDIGNKLSTEQFKDVDIEKHNFNMIPLENEILNKELFQVEFSYESFSSDTVGYVKVLKDSHVRYPISKYNKCRQSGKTKITCLEEMKTELIKRVIQQRERERENLKHEQSKEDYSNELLPKDIIITPEEIN